jgi:hypothetical protein
MGFFSIAMVGLMGAAYLPFVLRWLAGEPWAAPFWRLAIISFRLFALGSLALMIVGNMLMQATPRS